MKFARKVAFVVTNLQQTIALESVQESERTEDIIQDLPSEELPIERVIGIQWSKGLDCFSDSIILKDQPLTRPGV